MKITQRAFVLGPVLLTFAKANAGWEYELTQTWLPTTSKLTAVQAAKKRVSVGIANGSISSASAAMMESMFLNEEKLNRKMHTAKGKLRIAAGDWGSELVYPVINLSTNTTDAHYERFDGESTSVYQGGAWVIKPGDLRGLAGRSLDRYLLSGHLDGGAHRIEGLRLPGDRWKEVYERADNDSVERMTLIWSDERRTRLLAASNENRYGRSKPWRKGNAYRIVRPAPDGSGRLFDEAVVDRTVGDRARIDRIVFKAKSSEPSQPYNLLHDCIDGMHEIEEYGVDPRESVRYTYEGHRIDPHAKAVRKKWATRVGLSILGLMTLGIMGLLGWRSLRTNRS